MARRQKPGPPFTSAAQLASDIPNHRLGEGWPRDVVWTVSSVTAQCVCHGVGNQHAGGFLKVCARVEQPAARRVRLRCSCAISSFSFYFGFGFFAWLVDLTC